MKFVVIHRRGEVCYGKWHDEVEKHIKRNRLMLCGAVDRTLLLFDDRVWHQGVPAVRSGWRYFIRISRHFDKKKNKFIVRDGKRTNEVRKQVQVYMSTINAGW